MKHAPQITVYNFRLLAGGYESAPVSHYKATRQVIVDVLGGDPIESTAERVDAAEVDSDGHFRRLSSNWGDLS